MFRRKDRAHQHAENRKGTEGLHGAAEGPEEIHTGSQTLRGALLRAEGQEQQRRERCSGCDRKSRGRIQDPADHRTLPAGNGANGIRNRQRKRTGKVFSGKGCTGEEGAGGKKRKDYGGRSRETEIEGKPRFGEDGKRPSVRAKLEANKPLKWVDWNE